MGSYHSSFGYFTKEIKIDEHGNEEEIKFNSFNDYNLLITSFEPNEGFSDTFLSIDNISDDYYDGTKKFNYGSRYNSSAEIQITLIKRDKSDFSVQDFRKCAKWLTGAKVDSWLDFYVGDDKVPVYCFLGKFTNLEHYKLDGRIIGIKATFSSVSPWAWSNKKNVSWSINQIMKLLENGTLVKDEANSQTLFGLDDNGVLYADSGSELSEFDIEEDNGIIFFNTSIERDIDNESDDLYTYIYLDIKYSNITGEHVVIKNITLDEETRIDNVDANDIITISSKQFIKSQNNPYRIFGKDFNFVWPRMAPGYNKFNVSGSGGGSVTFTYRYPMKVGDCAMDLTVYSGDDGGCGNIASYDTIKWEDIIGAPTTLSGYGITDAYTKDEVYKKSETYSKDEVYNKNETYSQDDVYRKDETYSTDMVYTKADVYNKDETYPKEQLYTKDDVYAKEDTYAKEDLYTKDQVYTKNETYSKEEVYTKDETYSKNSVYTKEEIDEKIENIEISGGTGTGGSVVINEQAPNDMLADILG